MKQAELIPQFEALAEAVELRIAGIGGATIYRDSQFLLASRSMDLSAEDKDAARRAFNMTFERRVLREFPNHPRNVITRRNIANDT